MSRLKSASGLKHVMNLPEGKEQNSNRYNYDMATYTQMTSTPDLLNYIDKTDKNTIKNTIKKSNTNKILKHTDKISNENVDANINSLCSSSRNFISSTYMRITSTRIKSGSKTRVLVQKENQIKVQNDPLMNPQKDLKTDNTNIKKNILGSMHFYGNFINNPLTSNQYLINPSYNQNLMLMKSSKNFYSQGDSENMETNDNIAVQSSYEIKSLEEQQQNITKTRTNSNTDLTSSSNKFMVNGIVSISNLKQPRPQSVKLYNKKVCFSDLNDKFEEKIKTNSPTALTPKNPEKKLISINRNNLICKNIFLNYKPKESEDTNFNNILCKTDKNTVKRHWSNSEALLNRPKTAISSK